MLTFCRVNLVSSDHPPDPAPLPVRQRRLPAIRAGSVPPAAGRGLAGDGAAAGPLPHRQRRQHRQHADRGAGAAGAGASAARAARAGAGAGRGGRPAAGRGGAGRRLYADVATETRGDICCTTDRLRGDVGSLTGGVLYALVPRRVVVSVIETPLRSARLSSAHLVSA